MSSKHTFPIVAIIVGLLMMAISTSSAGQLLLTNDNLEKNIQLQTQL